MRGNYPVVAVAEGIYTPSLTQSQNLENHQGAFSVGADGWMSLLYAAAWTAAAGTGNYVASLPPGWQLNLAKSPSTAFQSYNGAVLGSGRIWNQGVNIIGAVAVATSLTSFQIQDLGGGVLNLSSLSTADGVGLQMRFPVKRL